MKKRASDPTRVVDLPPDHELAKLAPWLRGGRLEPPDGSPQVKWRVRDTLRWQSERRRRALRVVLVGGVVFCAGGVVGAMVHPILTSTVTKAPPAQGTQTPLSRQHGVHGRGKPTLPTPAPAEAPFALPTPSPVSNPSTKATGANPRPVPAPLDDSPASVGAVEPTEPAKPLPVSTQVASAQAIAHHPSATGDSPRPPRPPPPVSQPTVQYHAWVDSTAALRASPPAHAAVDFAAPPAPPAQIPAGPVVAAPPGNQRIATTDLGPPSTAVYLPTPAPRAPTASAPPKASVAAPPDEQALLTRALHRLRMARSPESALAALDEHAARFPSGVLAPEAARLRIEALLLSGRKDAALAELDRQSSDALPDTDGRRVLRGELRTKAGRWRAALADFDVIVRRASAPGPGTGNTADPRADDCFERALWGRASVRGHLGDEAGARLDLQDYLHRYPRGRFAAEATRLLGERR